ncbi:MAG: hypothetical protein ABIG89_04440 [Candidatus Woesearchaeota archaeon]
MAKKGDFGERISDLHSNQNSEKLNKINELLLELQDSTGKNISEIISAIKEKRELKKKFFPTSIINKKLGATESIVRYLKDELNYNYKDISNTIHRSEAVVGVMYRNSLKKFSGKLNDITKIKLDKTEETTKKINFELYIPFSVFSPKQTIFESIILYLKEKENLRYSQIAKLTSRDQRTIWTIYNRVKNKK